MKLKMIVCIIIVMVLLCSFTYAKDITTTLKVALPIGLPPYQFLDDNGEPAGMHIDILDAIADTNNFIIEYFPMGKSADCIEALNQGKVDIILGVLISDNTSYKGDKTIEISSSTLCMIASNEFLKDKSDISNGKHVAVFEYGTANYYFISELGAIRYVVRGNQQQVLEAQRGDKADLIVGVKDSILYQLSQEGLENEYRIIHNYMDTISYGMVVQKGDTSLLHLLNSGISSLRTSKEYERIYNNWITKNKEYTLESIIKKILPLMLIIAVCIAAYVIVSFRVRNVLKKQVAIKTKELSLVNSELEKRINQLEVEGDLRNIIIEYSPSGMVLFNKDFEITFINNGCMKLLGLQQPPIGKSIFDMSIIGEILQPVSQKVFSDGFSENKKTIRLSFLGEEYTYRYNLHQTIEYSEVTGALLTVEDVTREEMEKQKLFEKEKNKALSRLVAGIAHEIRNPLMSIRTFATLIQTRGMEKEIQESLLEFVPREVDRINALVQGLIDYAKPIKGITQITSVENLIEDCLYLTKTIKYPEQINVITNIKKGLHIKVCTNQIRQVIINIIVNSLESMEKKLSQYKDMVELQMKLSISSYAENGNVIISITDEGIGMSSEELKKCIEPFFTTKNAGTGLGLALSKQYIEENGGILKIESEKFSYTTIQLSFKELML